MTVSPGAFPGRTPTADLPPVAAIGFAAAAPCPRGGSSVRPELARDVEIAGHRFQFIPVRRGGLPLMPRQAQVLEFINAERDAGRGMPSYRAIAAHFGWARPSTPLQIVRKLVERGALAASELRRLGDDRFKHGRGI